MSQQTEARILVRAQPGGRSELSILDPATGRESRTGMTVEQARLDENIRKLKATLERSGSHVSVKFM
jgi:hypothetical protein